MKKSTHKALTRFIAGIGEHRLKDALTNVIMITGAAITLSGSHIGEKFGLTVAILGFLLLTLGLLHGRLVSIKADTKTGKDLEENVGEETAFLYRFAVGGSILLAWTQFLLGVII